jgi:hypothetical protein
MYLFIFLYFPMLLLELKGLLVVDGDEGEHGLCGSMHMGGGGR